MQLRGNKFANLEEMNNFLVKCDWPKSTQEKDMKNFEKLWISQLPQKTLERLKRPFTKNVTYLLHRWNLTFEEQLVPMLFKWF